VDDDDRRAATLDDLADVGPAHPAVDLPAPRYEQEPEIHAPPASTRTANSLTSSAAGSQRRRRRALIDPTVRRTHRAANHMSKDDLKEILAPGRT